VSDSVGRASILYVLKGWILFPLAIVSSILTARMLGPDVKGLFTLFLTTQGILILPGAAVGAALVHFVASQRPEINKVNRVIRLSILVQAAASVVAVGVLLQIPAVRGVMFGGLSSIYLVAIFLTLCTNLWIVYRTSLLSGLQQYSRAIFWGTVGTLITNCTSVLVLIFWMLNRVTPSISWMVSLSVSASLISAVTVGIATRHLRQTEKKTIVATNLMLTSVAAFALPVLLRSVVEWVTFRVDVYFVYALRGAADLGVYTVAVGIAQQLWMLPLALSGPLFAKISYQGDSEQSREMVRYAFRTTALISLVLGVVMAIAAPVLLPLAYGAPFQGAVLMVLVLLPGVVLLGPTRVINAYFSGRGRPTESLIAECIGLTATVILDVLLIPRYGAVGAAAASCVAYTAYSTYACHRFVVVSQSRWSDLIVRPTDVRKIIERLREQRHSLVRSPHTARLIALAGFRRA
jgi:O-antigen/teichoic acid export membrane protein